MWRRFFYLISFICCMVFLSCSKSTNVKGYLSVFMEDSITRSGQLDSNDFVIQIRNEKGQLIFNDLFGNLPIKYALPQGKYHILCLSQLDFQPNFDSPIYGDEKVVVVKGGEQIKVVMQCTMQSCGIKLRVGSNFLERYPNHFIVIEGDNKTIVYPFRENRPVYFKPGRINIFVQGDDKKEKIFSKFIHKREVLDLGLSFSAPNIQGKSFLLQLDTSKIWIRDNIGPDRQKDGNNKKNSMSVPEAFNNVGKSGVWVYGYIVGCVKIAHLETSEPFTMSTNIAIAMRKNVEDKEDCLVVELKKASIKSKLNLVDNPSLIGRKVFLKGEIVESYYGTVGLKKVVECTLE